MTRSALDELAEEYGLTLHYRDALGQERMVSDDVKRHMLEALGAAAPTERDARDRLAVLRKERAERLCPRSLVFSGSEPRHVLLRGEGRLRWRIAADDGRELTGESHTDRLDRESSGARLLTLPDGIPAGYHDFTLEVGDAGAQRRLILAPQSCHLPPSGERRWGVALQLYSLPSANGWGAGTYGDLPGFARAAAAQGAHFVGLNPLHALFPADPGHFGPYSPSSRAFYNTFYIDPGKAAASAAESDLVDYVAVDAAKRAALEVQWREFREGQGESQEAFSTFVEAGGEALRRQALFDALHEHFLARGGPWSWREWPQDYRAPDSRSVSAFAIANEDRLRFFCWLQFLADRQLGAGARAARDTGMEIGLYQDLAVGVDPSGAAAWADQHMIRSSVSIGAPPDELNRKGQNWGLAPYDPDALADAGYEPFIRDVRAAMRHAGAMRLDHVMALQRLFWIPRGADATEGVYVRYPRDALMSIVALESQRQRCVVVGEDLGTVPEGFGDAMRARNILTYKVLYFERTEDGAVKAPWDYPREALVTVTTHDLPTLRGALQEHDIDLMHRNDLYPNPGVEKELRLDRRAFVADLRRVLVQGGLLGVDDDDPEAIAAAAYGYLARTPSLMLAVAAEDLAGMLEQPNLPGTVDQHPNWRRRLRCGSGALFESAGARRIVEAIRRERSAP